MAAASTTVTRWLWDRAPVVGGAVTGFVLATILLVIAPIVRPVNQRGFATYWTILLLATSVVSAGGLLAIRRGWLQWTLSISVAVMGTYMIRILIDGAADPTSHNLWPFEIVFGFVKTALYAGAGALVGTALHLVDDRARDDEPWAPRWKRGPKPR